MFARWWKFAPLVLALGCGASSQAPPPEPEIDYVDFARMAADEERRSIEDSVRLAAYFACGGKNDLRCQQFAPESLRAIPPTIPLGALRCRETNPGPHGAEAERLRICRFELGDHASKTACRVTFRQEAGPHSVYWTEMLPPPRMDQSTLVCTRPLLAVTEAPEVIDPAPAAPPRPSADLATLIEEIDYPSLIDSAGSIGVTAMRLRVGSHGRIDGCTVTASSGSRDLDTLACELLTSRAFFSPARNARGDAVAAEISHSHRWIVPG